MRQSLCCLCVLFERVNCLRLPSSPLLQVLPSPEMFNGLDLPPWKDDDQLYMFQSKLHDKRRTPNGCEFASSSKYTLTPSAHPSGRGNLWEYYHFLIDFAPAMLYHIRDDRAPCKWLQVPGWYSDNKFYLTLPNHPQRSMEAHFEFLLGRPLNLTIDVVGDRDAFEKNTRAARVIDWTCDGPREWTGFPVEYYTAFRDHARALPGVPPALKRDIVAVKRGNLRDYTGPATGCTRRCLDEQYYDRLLEDSQSHGWDTAVVTLENQSVSDQIALFSNVKVVLAQHGAALSNIIFARPGTLVVEVGQRNTKSPYSSRAQRAAPCFSRLAQQLGLPYVHYKTMKYTDDVAQGIFGNARTSAHVGEDGESAKEVRDVIARFVLSEWSNGAPVRCPKLASCVGQEFAQ